MRNEEPKQSAGLILTSAIHETRNKAATCFWIAFIYQYENNGELQKASGFQLFIIGRNCPKI